CCYAWPERSHAEGPRRAFFVDQSGTVLVTDNAHGAYVGPLGGPAPGAALSSSSKGLLGAPPATHDPNGRGLHGDVWRQAVLPAESTIVVEVAGADGKPMRDVSVAILPPSPTAEPDDA